MEHSCLGRCDISLPGFGPSSLDEPSVIVEVRFFFCMRSSVADRGEERGNGLFRTPKCCHEHAAVVKSFLLGRPDIRVTNCVQCVKQIHKNNIIPENKTPVAPWHSPGP